MKVTCQECGTRFNLDDQHIKPDGTKVRCSKCSNVFTVLPPEPDVPAGQAEQLGETMDISEMEDFDFDLEEVGGKTEEAGDVEDDGWEETMDISQLDDLGFDLESGDDAEEQSDELDLSGLGLSLEEDGAEAASADDLDMADLLEESDDAAADISMLERTAEFEDLPDVKDVLKEGAAGPGPDDEDLLDFSLDEDDVDLPEEPDEIAMLEKTAELVDLPDAESLASGPGAGESAEDEGLDFSDLENILEDEDLDLDAEAAAEEELELDFELEDDAEAEEGEDVSPVETEDLDLSDLDLDLDGDEPVDELEEEELDLGDLDLQLEEKDGAAGEGETDIAAEDEELDFSDLGLDLEEDGEDQLAETATDDSEELDFGDLDLGDDSESLKLEPDDSDDLDFSDLEDMVESEEADTAVDLDTDESDLEISSELEIDLGEAPEITADDEITLPDFSLNIDDEEVGGAIGREEETVLSEAAHDDFDPADASPGDPRATMEIDAAAGEKDIDAPPPPAKSKRKVGKPVWILLILVLLGGGGAGSLYFLGNAGVEIPFVSGFFAPKVVDTAGNLLIVPIDNAIEGKYMANEKMGNIFVIKGRVRNDYDHPRSNIRVDGKIFGKGNRYQKAQIVFCGNQLSTKDLQTLDFETIQKRLSNKAGDNNSNVNVSPGKILPFMIVFPDVPGDLEEFTIEVAGSR